jgi:hypothetical protein
VEPGRAPLIQQLLPTADPLGIDSNSPIHIFSADVVNSSRPTLHVNTEVKNTGTSGEVLLSIAGNDALEKYDGVGVRVLFTGPCETAKLAINGRVIGSGIRKRAPSAAEISKNEIDLLTWLLIGMLVPVYGPIVIGRRADPILMRIGRQWKKWVIVLLTTLVPVNIWQ